MVSARVPLLAAVLAASFVLAGQVESLRAEVIGNATEARNQVTGELGSVVRTITVGAGVSANELVRTGPGSAAGLQFLDGTSLNIGEGSAVVLDTFVFDPNGPDDVVIDLTRGALRFVSSGTGPRRATIVTPAALLGIRGTDFITWCGDTVEDTGQTLTTAIEECAAIIDSGRVRVCPYDDRPFNLEELRRACDEGDQAVLPCGYYEIAATEEQVDDEEGNFLLFRLNCSIGAPANLPNSAFQALQAQIAAGLPPTLPSQLALLVTTTKPLGLAGVLGGIGALGTIIYFVAQGVSDE